MSNTSHGLALLRRLLAEPRETEWLEWKHNNTNPYEIGEYISALANSCALSGSRHGYVVWGVDDATRNLVGTTFRPESTRVQSQDLQHWLATHIKPRLSFAFRTVEENDKHFVILEIAAASETPVSFNGVRYIRVASHKKRLDEHPDYERRLWRALDEYPFADGLAMDQLRIEDVLSLIDYPGYFHLSGITYPENRAGIIEALQAASVIQYDPSFGWAITNLGAILFARDLEQFPSLVRRAVRVVRYKGVSRMEAIREDVVRSGYAIGFDEAVALTMRQQNEHEEIRGAYRVHVNRIPEVVIRELIANAMVHQDFGVHGMSLMVEIFDNRIEITNPGRPLIPADRFVDGGPASRNERLVRAGRLVKLGEERGMGWDKIARRLTTQIGVTLLVVSRKGPKHPGPLND